MNSIAGENIGCVGWDLWSKLDTDNIPAALQFRMHCSDAVPGSPRFDGTVHA